MDPRRAILDTGRTISLHMEWVVTLAHASRLDRVHWKSFKGLANGAWFNKFMFMAVGTPTVNVFFRDPRGPWVVQILWFVWACLSYSSVREPFLKWRQDSGSYTWLCLHRFIHCCYLLLGLVLLYVLVEEIGNPLPALRLNNGWNVSS